MNGKMQDFLPRRLAVICAAVDRVLEVFIVGLLLVFVTLTFIQVVLRYLFADSILWADEICRYLFIWMVFLAAGLVVGKCKHISIEILKSFLSEGGSRILESISDILIIIFSIFLSVYGWKIISISFTVIAPATEIPMSYFQMIFIVFGVVCIYRSIIHLVALASGREPEAGKC